MRLLKRDGSFNIVRTGHFRRFSDSYHTMLRMGWAEFLAWLLLVYLTINGLFAAGYLACGPGSLGGSRGIDQGSRFWDAFFFSVQTFATIGYGKITPIGMAANILVTIEALVGLLSLALATGLLFARFSKPTARVVFSNRAILSKHDGIPSLIFRIANQRLNQIVEAQVSFVLSINEVTEEGERYRNFYDLKLERSRSPIFALTWLVVHPIDSTSPLFEKTDEFLKQGFAEFVVSLTGIDDTFSQTIHARYSYLPDEIVWGGKFGDILSRTPDNRIALDLKGIHEIIEG